MPERNDCTAISSKIDHAKNCIKLYQAWDKKWYPGRHDAKLKTWNNRLDSLKEYHQNHCVNKYNYYDENGNKK